MTTTAPVFRPRLRSAVPLLAFGAAIAVPALSQAADITVNNITDAPRMPGLEGCECHSTLGFDECTLRAAVETANACTSVNWIDFESTLAGANFDLTIGGTSATTAADGDLDVTDGLRVEGSGQTIRSTTGERIWDVYDNLVLESVSMTEGDAGAVDGPDGGCLRNDTSTAALTFLDVHFFDCRADRNGGAVWTEGPIEYLGGSVLSNVAENNGGGVYVFNANAIIEIDTFNHNDAFGSGGNLMLWESGNAGPFSATVQVPVFHDGVAWGGHGGGLYTSFSLTQIVDTDINWSRAGRYGGGIYAAHGDLVMERVAVEGNEAGVNGGGIAKRNGLLEMTHSAVFGNEARNGAGIELHAQGTGGTAFADLVNVTISENVATAQAGGLLLNRDTSARLESVSVAFNQADRAGGVSVTTNSSDLELVNSFIAGNGAASLQGPDCIALPGDILTPGGVSLIDGPANCGVTPSASLLVGNALVTGTSGTSWMHVVNFQPSTPLVPGSDLDDGGLTCTPLDQRYAPRTGCDIGALEQ